jgi:hypothetical protein
MLSINKLLIVAVALLSFSCLTEKRFNRVLTKGLEKGWLDTTVKASNYVYINKVDTVEIEGKIRESILWAFKDTTLYKDTCYNKQGAVIGRVVNIPKLKKRIEKSVSNVVLPEIVHCLKKPIFFTKDGIVVEVKQDSLGKFDVNVLHKPVTINRPDDRGFWKKYFTDVWFLYMIIGTLAGIIIIKR